MDEQEVVTIIGYGSVNTVSTSYNIDGIEYDEGPEEGPEEDPASDWDKNVEFYARDAETGEWEQI